ATGARSFVGCSSYALELIRPDGSQLASAGACGTSSGFLEPQTLDAGGTWKLVLDPLGSTSGTASLNVYLVADQTAAITPTATGGATFRVFLVTDQTAAITPSAGGATINASVTGPGQNVVGTFTGTTGQRISETATNATGFAGCSSYQLLLVRPDGSTAAAAG